MGALTKDRNTPYMDTQNLSVPVAADAVIHAGAMIVANATGYAAPATAAANLTYLGRAEEAIDNTGGTDGAVRVNVRRGVAFKFANKAGDLVTQALMGKSCYIEDDQTVRATATSTSAAGTVVMVESDGVWVE